MPHHTSWKMFGRPESQLAWTSSQYLLISLFCTLKTWGISCLATSHAPRSNISRSHLTHQRPREKWLDSTYRDDIKDPAELGLMKCPRSCETEEEPPTGRAPQTWAVLLTMSRTKHLHRHLEVRWHTAWWVSLLNVRHNGLDKENLW